MPGARDAALFDDSFSKRPTLVRADAVEYADLPIDIRHAKSPPRCGELASFARRRQLGLRTDAHKF
jgi:hypothetical protein